MPHFSAEKQGHSNLSRETKGKEYSPTLINLMSAAISMLCTLHPCEKSLLLGRVSLRSGQINQTLPVPISSFTMSRATDA